jgi:hypothetical protein
MMNPMRSLLSILVISLFFLGAGMNVHAQLSAKELLEASFDDAGNLKGHFAPQIDYANTQFAQLPGPVRSIFGNQAIEVELTLKDGKKALIGVITQNEKITHVTHGIPIKETLRVWIDEETAYTIGNAPNIPRAFTNAVTQGKLRYEGITGNAQVTVLITNIMVWVSTLVNAIQYALGMR